MVLKETGSWGQAGCRWAGRAYCFWSQPHPRLSPVLTPSPMLGPGGLAPSPIPLFLILGHSPLWSQTCPRVPD